MKSHFNQILILNFYTKINEKKALKSGKDKHLKNENNQKNLKNMKKEKKKISGEKMFQMFLFKK